MSSDVTEQFIDLFGDDVYDAIWATLGEGHPSPVIRVLERQSIDQLNSLTRAVWQAPGGVEVYFEFYNGNIQGDGIKSFCRQAPE